MTRFSCISMQPRPVPEASQNTSNGLDISGCVNTAAEVKCSLKVWKALSHSLHTNLTPFFNSSVMGLAILEKSGINRRY
jgi:hypothetical protein